MRGASFYDGSGFLCKRDTPTDLALFLRCICGLGCRMQLLEYMNGEAILVSVVDDDESVRESLPALLKEFGYDSQTFATPQQFLESGIADKTVCLLLDIVMPGMSGPELWRELVKRGYSIPTIFISARPELVSQPAIREAAVAFLVKPFSDDALLAALQKALNVKAGS